MPPTAPLPKSATLPFLLAPKPPRLLVPFVLRGGSGVQPPSFAFPNRSCAALQPPPPNHLTLVLSSPLPLSLSYLRGGAGGAAPRNLVSPLRGGFAPKIPPLVYRPTFAPISPQKNQALFSPKLVYRPLMPSNTLKNTKIPSWRPFSISSKPAQNISDHFRLIMLLFDT